MVDQGYDWGSALRSRRALSRGVHAMDTPSSMLVSVVTKMVTTLDKNGMVLGTGNPQAMYCQWCDSSHHTLEDCQAIRESTTPQEQLYFIGNAKRFGPYNNTYNEG
ncbi:unnamed protein product [Linum trigynum]|uniref:Uncharacterized protein n=1 Tax=Linum trigynum TaxID=586398 RepID=A0AAV2D9X1_9ROSI